ncbi:MAG: D-alanine--D-alanine ligase [Clostridia bacterium]|nr:D-alanine--D-alanine ligase [Clostridia bacterium]
MKINLCVLFGGRSVEHEISVISALQAMENLNGEKYNIIPVYITKEGEMYTGDTLRNAESYKSIPSMLASSKKVLFVREGKDTVLRDLNGKKKNDIIVDVAFPIVHGTNVEDGALQGYLRTLGLPFVGCDVLASAVGMDKYVMKTVLKEGGFPVLDCLRFNRRNTKLEYCIEAVEKKIPYPVIVKPVNLGSSVGISKADNRESLETSLKDAFSYADTVLVERAVTALREINCSVVGDTAKAEASECEEPFMADEILSYKDKYMSGGGSKGAKGGAKSQGAAKGGMASLKRKVPADLTPEMRDRIRTMAVEAFQHLGCNGVSRIDFMIDNDSGELYINEFNTIPGSLAFYLWKPLGVEYRELLDRLISLALKRAREDEDITYSFDTNILAMGAPTGAKGAKGSKA